MINTDFDEETPFITLFSFFCGISSSPMMLISSRVLQGIGSSMIFSTGVAIVTSMFPEGERGKALGINVASVYLGLSLGPFFGGVLTEHLGWRSIFLINVPLGLIVIGSMIGSGIFITSATTSVV
jgi:MFS family permease